MFDREAWKEATWIFVLSRLAIVLITYIGISRFGNDPQDCLSDIHQCLQAWYRFDTVHFVSIAQVGYQNLPPYEAAFFPLYPLLIHITGALFGGSLDAYYFASLLIANLCFYIALVLLYGLVRQDFEASIARETLFFLAFSPFSLFFFAGYSESLFLLLCVAAFVLLQKGGARNWLFAGLCGAGAILTRSTGLVLLLFFLVRFLQYFLPLKIAWGTRRKEMLAACGAMLLIPVGLGLYMLYLHFTWDNPLLFSQGQAHWGRFLSPPWSGIMGSINNLLFVPQYRNERNLIDLIFTLLPLTLLCIGWRRLPLHYSIFALSVAFFSLLYPFPTHAPLSAAPRYLLLMFPVFVLVALWSKHPRVRQVGVAISLTVFAVHILLFIAHGWVG